jgi:hypothetical protein
VPLIDNNPTIPAVIETLPPGAIDRGEFDVADGTIYNLDGQFFGWHAAGDSECEYQADAAIGVFGTPPASGAPKSSAPKFTNRLRLRKVTVKFK